MTEVIGDFLERQAARHEMSGTGVPEYMRTTTWHVNVEPRDALRNDGIQAFRGHRSDGRSDLQKQLAIRAPRPGLFEVPDDRLSDDGHERIDLGTSRLGATDRHTVVLPIEVVETQRGHFLGRVYDVGGAGSPFSFGRRCAPNNCANFSLLRNGIKRSAIWWIAVLSFELSSSPNTRVYRYAAPAV